MKKTEESMSFLFQSGDRVVIIPFRGRRREITINRQSYNFVSSETEELSKKEFTFVLPSERGESFSFKLFCENSRTNNSWYVLRSTGENDLFEVNKSYIRELILSRGDEIRIGYNRLIFLKAKELESNEEFFEFEIDQKIVFSNMNILLQGETGTGKTRMAKIIHDRSKRSGRFVHLNLSSFSNNLFESEFFGHKKGSFTGAISDHPGAIFEAREGTLFLDEIDSLSLEHQKKLLLFLDSGRYRSVGSNGEKKSSCRMIFSSGQNFLDLKKAGRVRTDFYYRITSEFSMSLPSIREKPDLIKSFLMKFSNERDLYLSKELLDFYMKFSWPGNFRQLKAHLQKKVVLSQHRKLVLEDLDHSLVQNSCEKDFLLSEINQHTYKKIKIDVFKQRLRFFGGKYELASASLGVSKATLERAIKN